MPPTKPTLPVLDVLAAITPTRNEPSSALNTTDCTLGLSTTMSIMPNWVFGNSSATLLSAVAQAKPGITIGREAVLRELAQRLLALRLVLDFESRKGCRCPCEFGRAVEHAFVEGFVELAAEVVDHRRLDRLRVSRGAGEDPRQQTDPNLATIERPCNLSLCSAPRRATPRARN